MSEEIKKPSTWDEIRRLAEEVKLRIHLAGQEAKDKWDELKPKIAEVKADLEREGSELGAKVNEKLAALGDRLVKLRDDVDKPG